MKKIITRFPPSPTGEIHIGNMRTMLFNYLYAKQHGGEIFLRFEDTDRERSDVKFEKTAIEALHTLGLNYDHGPFRQSERTPLYTEKLKQLLDAGLAYEGEESQDGSGNKVIRFKNPNKEVIFNDAIRGPISIDSTQFEDFVIARSIDNPIYHFTVVVDDIDMGVTHVIRGEDHITSTPRQILLMEALGATPPVYAHLPLIVGEDKKKLSKRHGAVSVSGFIAQGYIPSAIVNYLAFLGWNPGGEREIYSLEELVKEFSLEKVGKNPAMFNYDKLADINRQHILMLSLEEYTQKVHEFLPENIKALFDAHPDIATKIIEKIIRERVNTFGDLTVMTEAGDFACFFTRPTLDLTLIRFKDDTPEKAKELLTHVHTTLSNLSEDIWTVEGIKQSLWDWSAEVGRGSVLHPLRTILSGKAQSPDPFSLAYILGKEETLARIELLTKN